MGCGGCRRQAMKKFHTVVKQMEAPSMLQDGSIQFPEAEALPIIEGYSQKEDGSQTLVPDEDCVCTMKITGIMLQQGGTYTPNHVCRHSLCEHSSKKVTMDICRGCPLREKS